MGMLDLSGDQRDRLALACANYIEQPHDKPFLLIASFINPHDICLLPGIDPLLNPWAVNRLIKYQPARLPEPPLHDFIAANCPPLPENYGIPAREPDIIQQRREALKGALAKYTDERWRLRRWIYCRMTEAVDAQIGVVLKALRRANLEDNTLIVLSSDHGDMDAAHRFGLKSVPYEEAVNIPFVVSFKGRTKPGLVDATHLVSNALDLMPTLCDYAGIAPPAGLQGRSVRALAEGRDAAQWRDQVIVECGVSLTVQTGRYKYTRCPDSPTHPEQLTDLQKDRGEMDNLAEDPAAKDALVEHRQRMERYLKGNPAAMPSGAGAGSKE
jgi:arylsulfatase A-like enzyme